MDRWCSSEHILPIHCPASVLILIPYLLVVSTMQRCWSTTIPTSVRRMRSQLAAFISRKSVSYQAWQSIDSYAFSTFFGGMFSNSLRLRNDIYPLRRKRLNLGSHKSHTYILPQFPAIRRYLSIRSSRLTSQERRAGTHEDVHGRPGCNRMFRTFYFIYFIETREAVFIY